MGAGEHGCAAELWGVLLREMVEGGGQIVSFKHLLVVDVHQRWPALGCVVCFNLQILQTLNLLAYVLLVAAILGDYFVVGGGSKAAPVTAKTYGKSTAGANALK